MNTQASRRVSADDLPSDEEFFLSSEKNTVQPSETAVSPAHRPFASETPGALIRSIREAQNVTAEEVAKRLYLDVQMIKNLESDNYSRLPPPIFVQGYLRAFAKLFNVPEEPLLAAYVKYNPNANTPPALASENTAQMPKVGVGHSSGRWWYYMTGVLLLGLTILIAWRYAIQNHTPRTDNPPPAENPTNSTTSTPSLPITPPNNQTTSIPYTPPSEAGGTKTPPLATTPPPVSMTPLPPVAGQPTTPPPTISSPSTTASPTETSTTSMASTPTNAGTMPTPPVVAPAEDVTALILKFKDVSFARVVDSKKKKHFEGTSKPGQVVNIKEGVPPYEISINKVTTVDVFYKGQPMNLEPFKNQRNATFTVGNAPKGSAQPEEEEEEE